jgi:hypothetical protein
MRAVVRRLSYRETSNGTASQVIETTSVRECDKKVAQFPDGAIRMSSHSNVDFKRLVSF